jgi:membrane protease YdiL (CAAX protease family)
MSGFQEWLEIIEIQWWEAIGIAYFISGLVMILLNYSFFKGIWKNFGEQFSSLEVEQMPKSQYRFTKYASFFLSLCIVWLFWPIIRGQTDSNNSTRK